MCGIKTAFSNLQLVYYGIYHDLLNTILNTVKSYIYKSLADADDAALMPLFIPLRG